MNAAWLPKTWATTKSRPCSTRPWTTSTAKGCPGAKLPHWASWTPGPRAWKTGRKKRRRDEVKPLTNPDEIKVLDLDIVQLSGYFYTVDLGPDVHPRNHYV